MAARAISVVPSAMRAGGGVSCGVASAECGMRETELVELKPVVDDDDDTYPGVIASR